MRLIKVSAWSKCGRISYEDVMLPAKRVVCGRCDGTGKHVNPAIDEHGISQEEFDQDPDFRESYFSGVYDIRCERCNGANVVDEIDEEKCKTRLSWWKGLIRHYNALQLESDMRMEEKYERMVGA